MKKIIEPGIIFFLALIQLHVIKAQSVVDIIIDSEDHTTLETAVLAAELDETLFDEGPFTVFAPTDNAFNALPDGTLEALLSDSTGNLAQILLYHVVEGYIESSSLSDNQKATTVQGQDVEVTINGSVMINSTINN